MEQFTDGHSLNMHWAIEHYPNAKRIRTKDVDRYRRIQAGEEGVHTACIQYPLAPKTDPQTAGDTSFNFLSSQSQPTTLPAVRKHPNVDFTSEVRVKPRRTTTSHNPENVHSPPRSLVHKYGMEPPQCAQPRREHRPSTFSSLNASSSQEQPIRPHPLSPTFTEIIRKRSTLLSYANSPSSSQDVEKELTQHRSPSVSPKNPSVVKSFAPTTPSQFGDEHSQLSSGHNLSQLAIKSTMQPVFESGSLRMQPRHLPAANSRADDGPQSIISFHSGSLRVTQQRPFSKAISHGSPAKAAATCAIPTSQPLKPVRWVFKYLA
jgi:hypothetical protein